MTVKAVSLRPHATCMPPPGLTLTCELGFAEHGALRIVYCFSGPIAALRIPAPSPSVATDGLWQHTCGEAFVAAVDTPAYHEFNFSPATTWAAYRFKAYRERDPHWQATTAPHIASNFGETRWQLEARLPAALLPPGRHLRLALTAVVETIAGGKSYWALEHAGECPDFHLRDSFTFELERP